LSQTETEYYSHCDRSVLEQKYADLRADLNEAPPGTQQRAYLKKAGDGLWAIGLARGIFSAGVRGTELDKSLSQVCQKVNCDLNGKDKIASLSDLATVHFANVTPDGLPQEIKEILVRTGYWQLIKDNLSSIVFNTSVSDDTRDNQKVAGLANPLLRQVEIDFDGEAGTILSPRKIASVLVHEAAHVAWRAQPLILQNTTPDERQAYATELAFDNKYVDYDLPQKAKHFLFERLRVEQNVRTANEILGYASDNFSAKETTLPSRGLDLSYDPHGTAPSFLAVKSDFEALAKLYPALDRPTTALLWEVLSAKAELVVSAKVIAGSVVGRPGLTLNRLAGKQELTPRQIDQLADFFNRLPLTRKANHIYDGLVFSASKSIGGDKYRISYGGLRIKLNQAILTAKIEAENPDPAKFNR
jgi:hypothetical protein